MTLSFDEQIVISLYEFKCFPFGPRGSSGFTYKSRTMLDLSLPLKMHLHALHAAIFPGSLTCVGYMSSSLALWFHIRCSQQETLAGEGEQGCYSQLPPFWSTVVGPVL